MRKIPTLFVRDDADRAHITREVTPGCEWVTEGLGIATRKFDGTCIRVTAISMWARREVKPGKPWPEGFEVINVDPVTHKAAGWEPWTLSPFARYIREAREGWAAGDPLLQGDVPPGTYELVGPKINGNPEKYGEHTFIPHGQHPIACPDRSFDGIRAVLDAHPSMEGLVFWRQPGDPDSDMAKIKRKDFA